MNYVTNTFLLVSSSVWSKQRLCFVHGRGQKREQKPTTKKVVGFHNHSPLLTMLDELQSLIKTHNLLDSWRFKNPDQPGFTWANPSMKIQCRLDYFFISKKQKDRVKDYKILPTIYSDHSAVALSMSFNESELPRGPGVWKFNNSLLSDTNYVELLTLKIPMFAKKSMNKSTTKGCTGKWLKWKFVLLQ